jgi:DNA-binding beta-propeller fold protein YncE
MTTARRFLLLSPLVGVLGPILAACTAPSAPIAKAPPADAPATASASAPPPAVPLAFEPFALPGATAPVSLDYLAFEPGRSRVWVPVGTTGSVDVFDTRTKTFVSVGGFKTAQREVRGQMRTMGPSAAAIGQGAAYIGDRASNEVCAVDTQSLAIATCIALPSPTDGVAYVGSAKEVWVTTPRDQAIVVLGVDEPLAPKVKARIALEGAPEGYAVDPKRGLFYTNLEDKNRTVVIDIARHASIKTWDVPCGEQGPRGVAVDGDAGAVFVACTDRVLILDGARDGSVIGSIATGAGVDNIDWLAPRRWLTVAAGKAATVTVDGVDPAGHVTPVAVGASVAGARNGVVDEGGHTYVADAMNARLLVFAAPK